MGKGKRTKTMVQKSRRRVPADGTHRDKYASAPRLQPPKTVEAEKSSSDALYCCSTCRYVGDAESMQQHAQRKRHWERVKVEPTRYRCKCGQAGTHADMKRHVAERGGFHQIAKTAVA